MVQPRIIRSVGSAPPSCSSWNLDHRQRLRSCMRAITRLCVLGKLLDGSPHGARSASCPMPPGGTRRWRQGFGDRCASLPSRIERTTCTASSLISASRRVTAAAEVGAPAAAGGLISISWRMMSME